MAAGDEVQSPAYYEVTAGGGLNSCLPCNDSAEANETSRMYMSSLGVWLAVPEWEAALTAVTLSLIIALTLVGNVLVILSVFTYRPLRSAPNFFIVSLAVADMTVAVLVLPFNVAYSILGRWVLGKILCEFWLTCDIYCCTNSILHLCVIAVDRYRAITDPVNYAHKRTLNRVFCTIGFTWVTSFLISSPPMLGWNDWPAEFKEDTPCTLTSQQGYVIYSSLGSFFLPLLLMTSVYIRIFIATRRRLRNRARASRLSAMARAKSIDCGGTKRSDETGDRSSISSIENNGKEGPGEGPEPVLLRVAKRKRRAKADCREEKGRKTRGHLETQLTVDDYDRSKLSPARLSAESVTEADAPLNRRTTGNHAAAPPKSLHSLRGTKKSGRQPSQQVSQFVEEKQRISLSKERKAARTLGIIMGVFVVCWLPFFLMYVILPFCTACAQPSVKLVNFITWLGYVNSSLNPIIYTIFNMDFRKAFKKLLHLDK